MLPRERVEIVLAHGRPDRIPLYGWVQANLEKPISERFGSVAAFEDHYEFDLAHVFGGPPFYFRDDDYWRRVKAGETVPPPELLDLPFSDPDDAEAYRSLREQIEFHKGRRGRWVYVQTPGIFEGMNGMFGIENHLSWLLEYPDELREIYRRKSEWNTRFAMNCLDLGADMIHVSDDWGAQNAMMFSPVLWREMIAPPLGRFAAEVRRRGGRLSLHSDGFVEPVVDDVLAMGFEMMHPWQESAGMSLERFRDRWRGRLTVMGGLCVQTVLGFGKLDLVEREIRRVMRGFADGGLIFCTTHFVQAHCSIEELAFAYDLAYRLARHAGQEN